MEISTRLGELNGKLETELSGSRRNSAELARSLETSKAELEALRIELEASRAISTELAQSAERSAKDSLELKEALKRAESSLRSLETSFEAYRKIAEARIASLSGASFGTRLWAAVASVLAVLGWSAFLVL